MSLPAEIPGRRRTLAVGLDLGSTVVKAAALDPSGELGPTVAEQAPPLHGTGLRREGDAEAYVQVATRVVESALRGLPAGTPLGIASQRSSFVLWNRDGRLLTALISWQDRRAADWCARHARHEPAVVRRTGVLLSAHYAGPKLAALGESRPELLAAMGRGEVRFGTLESYLVWRWTGGGTHETDPSMAARTAMYGLEARSWSPTLLDLYGVHRQALPEVCPTADRRVELPFGAVLTATVADQAAGALAVLDTEADTTLITLGTGGFLLRPTSAATRLAGYLTAAIYGGNDPSEDRHVLEGTINGAGAALDRYREAPLELTEDDPFPDAFSLPDVAGLGSPYWQADRESTLSRAAQALDAAGRRRVVLEGLLFRVRQILDDLAAERPVTRVVLSGGVASEPRVAQGLAALLGRAVEVLAQQEAGLTGAARLAAGLTPFASPATRRFEPGRVGAYLADKYPRWQVWLQGVLED